MTRRSHTSQPIASGMENPVGHKIDPQSRQSVARLILRSSLVWVGLFAGYYVAFRVMLDEDSYRRFVAIAIDPARPLRAYLIYFLLLNAALVAPGSASLVVLAAVPVFGPTVTFLLSVGAGTCSTIVSHQIGARILPRIVRAGDSPRITKALNFVRAHDQHVTLVAFATRAVPNPLYDLWGLAFGYCGISIFRYLPPAAVGGATAVAVLCFGPSYLFGH